MGVRVLTIGSLFSGIGGIELGLEAAGLGPTVWQVENNPFCLGVLAKHWPTVERYGDIEEARTYPYADLVCGGFPCQDVSSASRGKATGLAGARSGLWRRFSDIVGQVKPRWVIVENVTLGAHLWLPTVRRDLHLHGYDTVAVAFCASDVGAPHGRPRTWVIAHPYAKGEPTGALHGALARVSSNASPMWGPWPAVPGIRRMGDGVPRGLDRVRALGNSVVPRCAEVVGRMIVGSGLT